MSKIIWGVEDGDDDDVKNANDNHALRQNPAITESATTMRNWNAVDDVDDNDDDDDDDAAIS